VDDGSFTARNVVPEFKDLLNINLIERRQTPGSNPAIPINIGIKEASGEIVVITNPECMPVTSILESVSGLEWHNYWVSPCYSVSKEYQKQINAMDNTNPYFPHYVDSLIPYNSKSLACEGDDAWYEHPLIIPRMYYFFAAIHRLEILSIGGIDEDFDEGVGFEDDEFIHRIRLNNFECTHLKDLVLHQNHYTGPSKPLTNKRLYWEKYNQQNRIANFDREWGIL